MDYCYHTHTKRCGHAVGEDEDYVKEAIKVGVKYLGFSDHIMLPNFEQVPVRASYSLKDDYIKSIRDLKEKYKEQINIAVGFEAEYFPPYLDYYKELLDSNQIDYLILGHHWNWDEEKNCLSYSSFASNTKERVLRYVDSVCKAMDSGLFSIFAHPDIFLVEYPPMWDDFVKEQTRIICESSIKNDVPLEINLCGIRYGFGFNGLPRYKYPFDKFWKEVSKYPVKVVIGCDAHDPKHFEDKGYEEALEFAKECGIKLTSDYSFDKIINKFKKK